MHADSSTQSKLWEDNSDVVAEENVVVGTEQDGLVGVEAAPTLMVALVVVLVVLVLLLMLAAGRTGSAVSPRGSKGLLMDYRTI